MLFEGNFVKKEADQLDKIVDTLANLEEALNKMDATAKDSERRAEQKKALKEIEVFLKQTDRLEDIQVKKGASDDYGISEDYARQNKALQDIGAICINIHNTLDSLEESDALTSDNDKMEEALLEIKQILRSVGRYDNYAEDQMERQKA